MTWLILLDMLAQVDRVDGYRSLPKALLPLNSRKQTSGLLLLNSLSLDAPLVAISWQHLASRVLAVPLCWNEILLLFLSTWLAYAGDRLLDSLGQVAHQTELPRHLFVVKYRRPLLLLWTGFFLLTTMLALMTVDLSELISASFLVLGVAFYFLLCFLFPRQARIVVPRELVVSGVFVATVLFFPLVHVKATDLFPLACSMAAVLWLLAFMNCLGISCWEQREDRLAGEKTLATTYPALCRYYPTLNIVAALCLGFLLIRSESMMRRPLFAGATACIILLGLIHQAKISSRLKPVLADLSLLAPWMSCLFS